MDGLFLFRCRRSDRTPVVVEHGSVTMDLEIAGGLVELVGVEGKLTRAGFAWGFGWGLLHLIRRAWVVWSWG